MYKVTHGEREPITIDEWLRIFEHIGKYGVEHYTNFSNELQHLERIGPHGIITQSMSKESDLKDILHDYKDIIKFLMKMDIYMASTGNSSLHEDSLFDFFSQLQGEQLSAEDYIKIIDELKRKGITVIGKYSKGLLDNLHESTNRSSTCIKKLYSDGTMEGRVHNWGFKDPNWAYNVTFEPDCSWYIMIKKYFDKNASIPAADLETYMNTETFNIDTSKVPEKEELNSLFYNPKKKLRIFK